jgi:hypothetical protein
VKVPDEQVLCALLRKNIARSITVGATSSPIRVTEVDVTLAARELQFVAMKELQFAAKSIDRASV